MNHKTKYVVAYDQYLGSWIVKRNNATITDGVGNPEWYDYKEDAVKQARYDAKHNKPSELIVEDMSGNNVTEKQMYDR